MKVGNGKSIHFWFDNWMGNGRLIDITGAMGTTYLGVRQHTMVSEAVAHGDWIIRGKRSRRYHHLYESILAKEAPTSDKGDDVVLWKHGENDFKPEFSASATWEKIRLRRDKVGWSHVIWFTQAVPRYSFITWLAIRNRLSTGDRMRTWGLAQGCVLCGEPDETRDHLFFACPYSYTVWESLARNLLGRHINPDWEQTLASLQRMGGRKGMDAILAKLLFQTVVYHLWRERNGRCH